MDNVALQALVKAVSLGYLLGAVALSLTALSWHWLNRRISPAHRADALFWLTSAVFTINSILVLLIYLAVVSGRMQMTTNFFHELMYGGWAATFAIGGIMLLGLSIIISWFQWRRGHVTHKYPATKPPAADGLPSRLNGMEVLYTQAIPTLSLVGAWRPELWVNPGYWQRLTAEEQHFALLHETCHQLRRDNSRRLLLEAIATLYFILPWVRRLPESYEQDCELAVDDYCRSQDNPQHYISLVSKAVDLLLPRRQGTVFSDLSARQLSERVTVLTTPRREQPVLVPALVVTSGILISQAATALLLAFSVSRCLLTCYLGY